MDPMDLVWDKFSRIHILSEDKQINLELSPFDTELPVTPEEIKKNLKRYFDENKI